MVQGLCWVLFSIAARGQTPDFTASTCAATGSISVTVSSPGSGGPYTYQLTGCGTTLLANAQPASYTFTGIPNRSCWSDITVTDNAGASRTKDVYMPNLLTPGILRVYSYPCGPGRYVVIPVGGIFTSNDALYRVYTADGSTLLAGPQPGNVLTNVPASPGDVLMVSVQNPCGNTSTGLYTMANSTAIQGNIYCAYILGTPNTCSVGAEADRISGAVYNWTSPNGTTYSSSYASAPGIAVNNGDWQLSATISTGACTHTLVNTLTIQGCVCSGTVPIRYNYVRTQTRDCRLWLEWSTAWEENTLHFEIETQRNGEENWETTAFVPASNQGFTDKAYRREIPAGKEETIYIRIKQVDLDGQFSYSPVLKAGGPPCRDQKESLQVAPNPVFAGSPVRIQLETMKRGPAEILLTDLSGRSLLKKKIQVTGSVRLDLALPGITRGIYLLQVIGENGHWQSKTARLVIQ